MRMMKSIKSTDQVEVLAACYVRMSTEHQRYSTSNQMDVIEEYANKREVKIIKTYSDEGKSGLNIQGRDSLSRMLTDVESGQAEFSCILVYDVSRWGRFQDADESAYYEYICRRAGISVQYCAEQFENDGSLSSTIIKSMKRSMAGEYSRELSAKVFQGACKLIQLGYKQGGMAGYGLRRMMVDQNGQQKGVLNLGEQKSLQTDRVILVPGPPEEVEHVQWMYRVFIEEGKTESEIARLLNGKGIKTDLDRPWTRGTVHQVLTNEKYIGNNLYHRTSNKLKQKQINNPREKWIRAEGVFEPIVTHELFHVAQGIILARSRRLSDEEMLEKLRKVFNQHGRISGILIDEMDGLPSSSAFRNRFGSLVAAYKLVGFNPGIDYSFIEENRRLRRLYPQIISDTMDKLNRPGVVVFQDEDSDLIHLNGEISVSIVLCRHLTTSAGASRWLIRLDEGLKPDISIAVRMNATNETPKDYYLLPGIDMNWGKLRLAENNGIYLDAYRFDSLDYFYAMAERCQVEEAA